MFWVVQSCSQIPRKLKRIKGGGALSPPTKKQNILNLPRIVIWSTMQFNSTSLCLVWNIPLGLWFKPPFPGRRTTDLGDASGLPGEGVWGGTSFYTELTVWCARSFPITAPSALLLSVAPVKSGKVLWGEATGMCNAFPNLRSLPDTLKKCSLIGERWNSRSLKKVLRYLLLLIMAHAPLRSPNFTNCAGSAVGSGNDNSSPLHSVSWLETSSEPKSCSSRTDYFIRTQGFVGSWPLCHVFRYLFSVWVIQIFFKKNYNYRIVKVF